MAMTKASKYPPEFGQKVDRDKVNIDLMKKWIAGKIEAIMEKDDDIVIDMCYNMLDVKEPDIAGIYDMLEGFLGRAACTKFCKELWNLMLSAQNSPIGVPKELLEAKKLQLQQEQGRHSNDARGLRLTRFAGIQGRRRQSPPTGQGTTRHG
ncbi:PWI domain-containing protein [Polyplosphaeria fusca]|uniref:PWI domain-containing protein n=1 Tax=Polyplosphaeria fusca TaxID=682080 RepID=A0A9P4R9T0_9PLEO|nr:PWI domain-containing protein [Polyplosphaeria fusca]